MKNAIIEWAIRILGGISKDQWSDVLRWVAKYAEDQLSGNEKRAKVLELLAKIGITGSRANWLVEAAVAWLKRIGGLPA